MVALAYVDAMFFLTAIANGILSISLIGFFSPKVGVWKIADYIRLVAPQSLDSRD